MADMPANAIREAARLIAAVYEFHDAGGNCHIAIDDGNLADDDLAWCLATVARNPYGDPPAQLAAERRCLEVLAGLTPEQRGEALVLHERGD